MTRYMQKGFLDQPEVYALVDDIVAIEPMLHAFQTRMA